MASIIHKELSDTVLGAICVELEHLRLSIER